MPIIFIILYTYNSVINNTIITIVLSNDIVAPAFVGSVKSEGNFLYMSNFLSFD